MVESASCMTARLSGTPMWPWDTERARVRVVTQPPTLNPVERGGLTRPPIHPSSSSSPCCSHLNWLLRCAHSSLETKSHHNSKKEAMLLWEGWDKKDRAYLCGCMAAWHNVMSTLIKHGGHSQPSAGEGTVLQARRSGPSDVSPNLTGRLPHRQDTRPRVIGWNVSWVIIFVQCRQGQHCESQRQGKKNEHRARS